ncbi:TMV resistance protein N [Glycine max]|nr:TMV resistance protein N [Glycine max]
MASNAIIQYGSSSSSSSHAIITASDVFVSFRGEDTLNNFTVFLFDALSQNGIDAFKDDTHLQKGESIAPEVLQAIEESLLFLVVFSKNYASSTRCLRELAHICNCTDEASPSRVLPVFYDVDPSEVRKQSGYYGIAFAEHERRFREDIEKMEEVLRWREALTQVANISGWDIRNKSHPAMIKEIVQKIKYILGPKFQNFPNGNLVGMESRVEELEKCLALELVGDVRVVRISGIGGIGKTTLALAFTGGTDTLLSECLGEGSRIVIICKDEQLLRTHEVYHVYRVQPLNRHIAVQLFCKNAFKCDYIMSDYETLTHDVLSHAQGHPLAIEVISKSLHCRNVSQWRGRLVRLSDKVSKHTLKVLGIRSFCNPVRCLFPSFSIFSCIRELDLSFCNLLKIPDAFGNLHCLERISLSGNNFETLPSLKELSKLLRLDLRHCKRLKYLPELPSQTDWRPSDIRLSSLQDDESDDESDHLRLFYYTRSHFDVSNFDELKVESRFRDLYDQDLDVEVKKCGYDRVYVRDLEPSLNTGIGKRKRGFDYEDLIKDVPSSSSFTNDVFLSFRGEDTRYSFTGNLCRALRDSGIHTFVDDDELQRGDEITSELEKEIEDSRFFIIVLSQNYASSSFCLNVLAYILECVKRKRLLVLPIFYKVDPSSIRFHGGSFGEALANHEMKFKAKMDGLEHNMEKLEKWKMALHETANFSGYHFKQGDGYEYEFITRIVELVSSKIKQYPFHVGDYRVGLEKLLDVGRDDGVHMLGIHGIDGVGKSTLAREVYNKLISDHFDASCFIENVREKSKKHGLHHLQNILLSKILGEKDINLTSAQQEISMMQRHRLQQKKVLMVLDDVDRPEQLQAVTGKPAWFGPGSKVIITTQDKQLLTSYDINRTYEVKKLNKDDALQLLKWKAFKMHYFDPRYKMLLNRAVTFASSLPLTLEILASYLFGKSVKEWKFTFHQFVRSPNNPMEMILKVIFDSLKEKEKSVLLDIACYFKGYELTEVQDILHAHYGQCMKYYIDVLVDKSLVYITHGTEPCNDTITMHELIAKEIVRLESMMTKPGECRRLWSWEDVREVFLGYKTATSKIEIICLDYPIFDEEEIVQWDGTTFQNMQNLKTLIIRNGNFSKGPEYLPNSLRVFEWWGYPSHCLPSDFHPKELAICKLPCSRISTTELTNLLTKFVNVKRLKFSSEKLKILSAFGCIKLRSFPTIKFSKNIRKDGKCKGTSFAVHSHKHVCLVVELFSYQQWLKQEDGEEKAGSIVSSKFLKMRLVASIFWKLEGVNHTENISWQEVGYP